MHQQILNYLAPMLGAATAANLLRHYCVKMGISAEDIKQDQLPQLAEAMRPMLAVWLGSEGAMQVAQELRQLKTGG
ncbi:MAG: hypothetical protein AB1631_13030 [Acidobacteriota bacterium]